MKKIATPILLTAFLCSCMQSADVPPVSQSTIMQLTGTWLTENKHGNIQFYNDETAKLTLPKHNPPIKLISPYEAVKENTIGIALGGFWSGPVLIDTNELANGSISATFPDEDPFTLHKE